MLWVTESCAASQERAEGAVEAPLTWFFRLTKQPGRITVRQRARFRGFISNDPQLDVRNDLPWRVPTVRTSNFWRERRKFLEAI